MKGTAGTAHLDYLDSTRGIAAFSVIVYHFINWKYEDRLAAKVGSIVFNGSDAVSFFFVLSGFVLSYPYIVGHKELSIPKFYVARFFRLWPAFFLTVVLNALNWSRTSLDLATMRDVFVLNKTQFWNEALLFRSHPHYFTPGWTLTIELCLSLVVPFMIVVAKNSVRSFVWAIGVILFIGGIMGDYYMFHFHFALGVLLSCMYHYLGSERFADSWAYRRRHLVLTGAIALYSIRHLGRIHELPGAYVAIAKYLGIDFFHYTAIGSFVLIAFLIHSRRAQAFLQQRPFLFLGKISYGIYLSHWLLVTDIFAYWDQLRPLFPSTAWALGCLFCAYCLVTIVLATMIHYWVELPFIRMGKRVVARWK